VNESDRHWIKLIIDIKRLIVKVQGDVRLTLARHEGPNPCGF